MSITYRSVLGSNEGVRLQEKSTTPYTTAQTIIADAEYDGLSKVEIDAIYYNEVSNSAGGTTVTIGIIAPE